MTSQLKPTIFSFESAAQIRAISMDGNPWFVSADVCKALGIAHTGSAMRALDEDEKGVHSMHTPGGNQDFTIISESGLYTLILRCRDAVTPGTIPYRFRKWVTSEVLPQIRHTGHYSIVKPETLADLAGTGRAALPAPQDIAQSMMQAIMEAIKSQTKHYHYPKKPNYLENLHTPAGIRMLTDRSQLMDLIRELEENGNDVSAPAVELVCLLNYVAGVEKVMQDIATHAAYITHQVEG